VVHITALCSGAKRHGNSLGLFTWRFECSLAHLSGHVTRLLLNHQMLGWSNELSGKWRSGLPAHLRTGLKEAPRSFRATRVVTRSASHVAATALLQKWAQHARSCVVRKWAPWLKCVREEGALGLAVALTPALVGWYKSEFKSRLLFWNGITCSFWLTVVLQSILQ